MVSFGFVGSVGGLIELLLLMLLLLLLLVLLLMLCVMLLLLLFSKLFVGAAAFLRLLATAER